MSIIKNVPTIGVETITPEKATEYLARNTHNRNIRDKYVDTLARDMIAGNWKFNGASIAFDENGVLSDGQHRLTAITRAGVAIDALVVRGVVQGAQDTMDAGVKRTFGDVLKLRGEKNANSLAATVKLVATWDAGLRRKPSGSFSNTELLAALDAHPTVRASSDIGREVSGRCGLTGAPLGLCHHLFSGISGEDAEFFFGRLADGVNLSDTSPIYRLREVSVKFAGATYSPWAEQIPIIIKAWNAFRRGDEIKLLRYSRGGARPESFPEPI